MSSSLQGARSHLIALLSVLGPQARRTVCTDMLGPMLQLISHESSSHSSVCAFMQCVAQSHDDYSAHGWREWALQSCSDA